MISLLNNIFVYIYRIKSDDHNKRYRTLLKAHFQIYILIKKKNGESTYNSNVLRIMKSVFL